MRALLFLAGTGVCMFLVGLILAARASERWSERTWGRYE